MILKDDIPKKCSSTRMILYSLHYKALQLHIECFHRHAIKIKIKNHSVDKVKKL